MERIRPEDSDCRSLPREGAIVRLFQGRYPDDLVCN